MSTRIGHLSDIHVPALEPLSIKDVFSKRITGFLNFKLKRQKEYDIAVLEAAVQRLIDAKVDAVIISGDLTNLAYLQEFEAARALLTPLSDAGIPWFVIPGNHDRYLAAADDGRMERVFHDAIGVPLSDAAYPWVAELDELTLVGLNSAVPTRPFDAWGVVSGAQIDALRAAAERLAHRGKPIVFAVHHHIGRAPNKKNDATRNLRNSDEVLALARALGVALIVHGHNHFLDIRDVDGVRVFAASSGISNQAGVHRSAGQVAIHHITADGAASHEVAFWSGDTFGPWTPADPDTLPPPPPLR